MRSCQINIADLVDAPRNANRMSPAKRSALRDSIERFGFVVPIVAKELAFEGDRVRFEIVDGHHRRDVLRELGAADAWTVVLDRDEDPRVVALALNRLRGETDLAIASLIIAELVEEGLSSVDLAVTGFSDKELADLVSAANSADDVELEDLSDAEMPEEIGSPVAKPYLLDLSFRTKEDLAAARKALRKAVGKGGDLSDGLLRLIRGES